MRTHLKIRDFSCIWDFVPPFMWKQPENILEEGVGVLGKENQDTRKNCKLIVFTLHKIL
jgi:hypothetical protein